MHRKQKVASKYSIDATNGAVYLEDLSSIADIELNNQKSGSFSIEYATGVTDGSSDETNINLSSVGTIATEEVEEEAVSIELNGIETLNISVENSSVIDIQDDVSKYA